MTSLSLSLSLSLSPPFPFVPSRLDAKIDSKNAVIVINNTFPTVYEQLVEKTKGLCFRSYTLGNQVVNIGQQKSADASAVAAGRG